MSPPLSSTQKPKNVVVTQVTRETCRSYHWANSTWHNAGASAHISMKQLLRWKGRFPLPGEAKARPALKILRHGLEVLSVVTGYFFGNLEHSGTVIPYFLKYSSQRASRKPPYCPVRQASITVLIQMWTGWWRHQTVKWLALESNSKLMVDQGPCRKAPFWPKRTYSVKNYCAEWK